MQAALQHNPEAEPSSGGCSLPVLAEQGLIILAHSLRFFHRVLGAVQDNKCLPPRPSIAEELRVSSRPMTQDFAQVVPQYNSEMAPNNWRGAQTGLFQLFVTLGTALLLQLLLLSQLQAQLRLGQDPCIGC